jgi:integrase
LGVGSPELFENLANQVLATHLEDNMATVYIQKRILKQGMSYYVLFRDPETGKKRHYKAFRKKREASKAANDLRYALENNKIPKPSKTKIRPITFSEAGRSLQQEWDQKLKRKDIRPKTHYEYCNRLKVVNRHFGKSFLCSITKEKIEAYVTGVAIESSNVTANRSLSIIKKVFRHGVELNAIITDVSDKIPFLSEKGHVRNRFLLPAQLDMLIEATQLTRAKYYMKPIIYLGAEHGASKQEVLSLKWDDIDFDFQNIGLIRLFREKTNRERTEFLMPRTKKALLEWKDHLEWKRHRTRTAKIKSDHVFCRIDGTPKKSFSKAWRASVKHSNIKNFRFHDLRHTFCSNLIMSGADLKDAKEMIGHRDISMTDRYSHLTNQHKYVKQKRLAAYYESAP